MKLKVAQMADNNFEPKTPQKGSTDQELKKAVESGDNDGDGKRSKQGMIDRATEPDWYGVTSF